MGDTMTAHMTTTLPKSRIRGNWIAMLEPVDGQLWDRLAERWETVAEPEPDYDLLNKIDSEQRAAWGMGI